MKKKQTGTELEEYGRELLEKLGFKRLGYTPKQVLLRDLDPEGGHGRDDHMEIDYVLPFENTALVGEISDEASPKKRRDKFRKLDKQITLLDRLLRKKSPRLWTQLGVPEKVAKCEFKRIASIRGFFITTSLSRQELQFPQSERVQLFDKMSWQTLQDYSESIGSYGKNWFLDSLGIVPKPADEAILITEGTHGLKILQDKIVTLGSLEKPPECSLVFFDASPYKLLKCAGVLRRDGIPSFQRDEAQTYQRALLPSKIKEIRKRLGAKPTFAFPQPILVTLSEHCKLTQEDDTDEWVLSIPSRYGAISIIDGQHRLFSYAHEATMKELPNARIMVTGVLFDEPSSENALKASAQVFVEVNSKQTSIPRDHLNLISFPVLGETTPIALASAALLHCDKRDKNKLAGRIALYPNARGMNSIRASEIISQLKRITDLSRISRAMPRKSDSRGRSATNSDKIRKGYRELMFVKKFGDLEQPLYLVEQTAKCLERYFNLLAQVFPYDFPGGKQKVAPSSLEYSKVLAGLVRLLDELLIEGRNFNSVKKQLYRVKTNVVKIARKSENELLFLPSNLELPNSNFSAKQNFQFFNANRKKRTRMKVIVGDVTR